MVGSLVLCFPMCFSVCVYIFFISYACIEYSILTCYRCMYCLMVYSGFVTFA